jgi:hypothetical protein
MKTKSHRKSVALALLGALVGSWPCREAKAQFVTDPVGYVIATVKAGDTSLVGIPLVSPALYSALVVNVSGAAVTLNSATIPAVDYMELRVGRSLGLTLNVAGVAGAVMTLDRDVSALIDVGDRVQMRAHQSIVDIFRTGPDTLVQEGTDPTTADTITLLDPEAQIAKTYYRKTGMGWVRAGAESEGDQSDVLIPYPQGVVYKRNGSTDVRLIIVGHVPIPLRQKIFPVYHGRNLITPQFTSAPDLAVYSLNDSPFPLLAGNSAPESDLIIFTNSDGEATPPLYYRLGHGWRAIGRDDDFSRLPLDFSPAVDLQRRGQDGYLQFAGIDEVESPVRRFAAPVVDVPLSFDQSGNALTVNWKSESSKSYQLQKSASGFDWKNEGKLLAGTDGQQQASLEVSGNGMIRIIEK